jgi:galactokinase
MTESAVTSAGPLQDLLDVETVAERLALAGFSGTRALEVRRQVLGCAAALRELGAPQGVPATAFVVPGRIEVLGKHTDYAGGRSLLAAAERGFTVVAVPRTDDRVRVLDAGCGEVIDFRLDPELVPAEGWANYPMTAARRLARNFLAARVGADLAFVSDLPAAAGMSSSSALVTATVLALAAINRLDDDPLYLSNIRGPEELAGYLATVENGQDFRALAGDRGVGTHGGSEDHTAMLCAQAGHLVQYAFAPVRFERVLPLPPRHTFVIGVSGVRAEKTGAAKQRYNRAAELMRAAADLWRAETGRAEPTIGAVLDGGPAAAHRLSAILRDQALRARVEQFVAEDREIIPAAGDALLRQDLATFGVLVAQSQSLAERLLGNQIAETTFLVRSARESGAVAASAFGAGFGGSVWALVEDEQLAEFQAKWRSDYVARFPEHSVAALFFPTRSGPPVVRIP